jgi:hypothetical protein
MSGCEVSWFSALCDDDYEFLGVADARLQSLATAGLCASATGPT